MVYNMAFFNEHTTNDIIEENCDWLCGRIAPSRILTSLIQSVGRLADKYASDFYIEWISLEKKLADMANGESIDFLFGIRALGVDSAGEVIHKLNDYGYMPYYYRDVRLLTVVKYEDIFHMTLKCVNIW